jgi:hypothetical protein
MTLLPAHKLSRKIKYKSHISGKLKTGNTGLDINVNKTHTQMDWITVKQGQQSIFNPQSCHPA